MKPAYTAIIGAGPAGLMAAEILSARGFKVDVFEKMPSPSRKFLMAGRGGLNLTHSENLDKLLARYGDRRVHLTGLLTQFPPQAVRDWADGLGAQTFVGSSGRIFPKAMKASPLLRAWLQRLSEQGVVIHTRHDWQGWDEDGALRFATPQGAVTAKPDITVLALGGASWPRLGADGSWVDMLTKLGVDIAPFRPANMGLDIDWSEGFKARFAGKPLKNIGLSFADETVRGEALITRQGLEGGAVYALSAAIREALARGDAAFLTIDLRPDLSLEAVSQRLEKQPLKTTVSNRLRKALKFSPEMIGLYHEQELKPDVPNNIKNLRLRVKSTAGLERAISSAGGIRFESLNPSLELINKPSLYCVGEMLDWEAPTGGYLLQASFATAAWAASNIIKESLKAQPWMI
jgi:uncharacterized flavoprotein (TIGR03862 family)